ncbi:MAG: FtsW/RodA/SpoVE family cell cycle protein [Bryobacteraceae bacterium]|nr:FtsW/RodA/SpoVE family cell cycle protein [Bryobacteraceae bacterium]
MAQQERTDWILLFTTVAMVVFGLAVVTSASSVMAELKFKSSYYFVSRQAIWAVLSFIMLMWFKHTDYRRLNKPVFAFAPLGIITSMIVIAWFADPMRHRWLSLGALGRLQPSEFAKPALIVFLAWFIALRLRAINHHKTLAPALLASGALGAAVIVADLGTALVLICTVFVLFFIAGLEKKLLFGAAALGLLLLFVAIAAKPYRLARVAGKFDPEFRLVDKISPDGWLREYIRSSLATRDPGYQARQSRIAVGAGGVLGVGLAQGRQKLLYLPEAHTDFIYAVVGEELGMWGCTGVLGAFFVLLWRGLRLFFIAPDDFGRYLALGVTVCIVIQALMNMSVVLDMGPTKGIPLPMISYGGSSLMSTLILLGMLLSVSENSRCNS